MYEKLLNYAFNILARKRYSTSQLKKKLRGFVTRYCEKLEASEQECDEAIVAVLDRLKELNYLNDLDYSRDYMNERVRLKPRGISMMTYELRKKGIAKHDIHKTLDELQIDEKEMALRILEKKKRKWEELPIQKQKNKAYQFLLSKGFKGDAIYKAVRCCYDRGVKYEGHV